MARRAAGLSVRQVATTKTPGYFADGNGLGWSLTELTIPFRLAKRKA
jgi:hypothetical protein